MNEYLVDLFFKDEADVVPLVFRELETRTTGRRRFTFNITNVVIDFDAETATIEDVLEADVSYSMPLSEFRARVAQQVGGT